MKKTTCQQHRYQGYAYHWVSGAGSTLTCKACGLSDEAHETVAETMARLSAEEREDMRSDLMTTLGNSPQLTEKQRFRVLDLIEAIDEGADR